jgi:hypothetical protein
LIGTDDIAQILGIQAGRQRRRTDQIAEHDGQVPTLGARWLRLRVGLYGGHRENVGQMAHNLFSDQMAFVGNTPWHRLGRQVPPHVTSEQMLKEANLDWKVRKVPATGARIVKRRAGEAIYDRYFIERDRVPGETVRPVLGVVGAQYELLQNNEAFSFFDPFLEPGHAGYETAGALGNGERVWVQVPRF